MKPRIAITMGDPAGIGPEICLHLLRKPEIAEICVPIVFGDATVLARCAAVLGVDPPPLVQPRAAWPAIAAEITQPVVLDFASIDAAAVIPGQCSRSTGRAAYEYIQESVTSALAGYVDGVVTGPVHKEALHAAGFPFAGHTEYFAAQTGAQRTCMMLTSADITCSLVTGHVGLQEVAGMLSTARIQDVIELSHAALQRMLRRPPLLTVCGLNPHAGENGLFGSLEEQRLIVPAIEAARAKGIRIEGPLPPDTAFLPARRSSTDGYICMYHDQGLIPLKALAFDRAVNVTLGLPIVRTSVDHGTALDIAWENRADATSLLRAVELAARLVDEREREMELAERSY